MSPREIPASQECYKTHDARNCYICRCPYKRRREIARWPISRTTPVQTCPHSASLPDDTNDGFDCRSYESQLTRELKLTCKALTCHPSTHPSHHAKSSPSSTCARSSSFHFSRRGRKAKVSQYGPTAFVASEFENDSSGTLSKYAETNAEAVASVGLWNCPSRILFRQ